MEYLFKAAVLWLSLDIFLVATAWYTAVTIKPNRREWWERHICAPYPSEIAINQY